jgi:uncharacterized protein
LDEFWIFLAKLGLSAGSFLGFMLIAFGLPGNFVIAACGLAGPALGLGWTPFFVLLGLAILAEILEFTAMLGQTRKSGASKYGAWGAFLGSIVGAIFFTPLIPIPILGTLFGAAFGAFAGAFGFEIAFGARNNKEGVRVGWGAFLGTLLGKTLKMMLGAAQCVLLLAWLWGFFGNG